MATTKGLRIVDASNSLAPVVVGSFETPSDIAAGQDVEIVQRGETTLAFLAAWLEGVFVLDVTDPSNPAMLAHLPSRVAFETASYEVTVVGSTAFVADGEAELRMFDVTRVLGVLDPEDPRELPELAVFDAPGLGYAWDVEVSDGVAYIAFGDFDSAGRRTGGVHAAHISLMGLNSAQVQPFPEPNANALAAAGLMALLTLARSRRRSRAGGRDQPL